MTETNPKVLIVDDKVQNLVSLERILSGLSVRWVRATSGNEALAKLLTEEFALVLMDVQMPGMDGFETVEWMRQDSQFRDLPVIFLSAVFHGDEYRIRGVKTGGIDFLSKPIVPELLEGKVKIFLDLYRGKVAMRREIEKRKVSEAALEKLKTQLEEANENLEKKVDERTSELLRANASLQEVIEARVEAEAKRLEALEELKRSNDELQQFAYVASHDLQEPLRMVSSFIQLLGKQYADQLDDRAREYIDFAKDGAIRMQRLIRDLLNYSRLNTCGGDFKPADSRIPLEIALSNLKTAIAESDAQVTVGQLPAVVADSNQLVQLFQNLIANGIKFTKDKQPKIHIDAEKTDDFWRFKVKDNGIGIDEAQSEKVFSVFQRLHNRTEYPGTGIGLAVCKRIVERHGGKIWLESKPGEGAAFFFTLPAAQESDNWKESTEA